MLKLHLCLLCVFGYIMLLCNASSSAQYLYQLFYKAMDEDGSYDAIVDYGYYNFFYPSKNYYYYTYMYGQSGGTNVYLYVRHKWYCPVNYYDTYCTRYCIYTDNSNGHYSCDSEGYPVCLNGWTGTSTYCKTGIQPQSVYCICITSGVDFYFSTAICRNGCSENTGFCTTPNTCR